MKAEPAKEKQHSFIADSRRSAGALVNTWRWAQLRKATKRIVRRSSGC